MSTPREIKYIIVELMSGMEIAILFPDTIYHNSIDVSRVGCGKIVSAGACKICAGDHPEILHVDCYGGSLTLKVESRGEIDAEIVLHTLQRPW